MGSGRRYHKEIKTDLKVLDKWDSFKKRNPIGMGSDYKTKSVANTRHLKRILIYLKEVDYSFYSDLREKIMIIPIKDALLFLVNNNIIRRKARKSHFIYYLPEKENIIIKLLKLENERYQLNSNLRKNENRLE